MSPTPVTFGLPNQPATYSWEATDEEVAARFGIPIDEILRFDLNTSPQPPEAVAGILAAGVCETPLSEYPPSDYRRLVAAAAAVYGVGIDEILVGAGADEILDLVGKAFLPPGGRAVVPVPKKLSRNLLLIPDYAVPKHLVLSLLSNLLPVHRHPLWQCKQPYVHLQILRLQ